MVPYTIRLCAHHAVVVSKTGGGDLGTNSRNNVNVSETTTYMYCMYSRLAQKEVRQLYASVRALRGRLFAFLLH